MIGADVEIDACQRSPGADRIGPIKQDSRHLRPGFAASGGYSSSTGIVNDAAPCFSGRFHDFACVHQALFLASHAHRDVP